MYSQNYYIHVYFYNQLRVYLAYYTELDFLNHPEGTHVCLGSVCLCCWISFKVVKRSLLFTTFNAFYVTDYSVIV